MYTYLVMRPASTQDGASVDVHPGAPERVRTPFHDVRGVILVVVGDVAVQRLLVGEQRGSRVVVVIIGFGTVLVVCGVDKVVVALMQGPLVPSPLGRINGYCRYVIEKAGRPITS